MEKELTKRRIGIEYRFTMSLATKRRRVLRRFRKAFPRLLPYVFSVLVVAVQLYFYGGSAHARLESSVIDTLFRFRGAVAPPEEILLVSIDEGTYSTLGLSTLEALPRSVYVSLLKRLHTFGSKRVFFDLVFRSPAKDSSTDDEFAEALTLLPSFLGKYVKYHQNNRPDGSRLVSEEWHLPREPFKKSAAGLVALNLELERGVVRAFPRTDPSLPYTPLAALLCQNVRDCFQLPGLNTYVDFYGPAGTLKSISLGRVLTDKPESLAGHFRGKTVLVGNQSLTQIGIDNKDAFYSPYSEAQTFGLEIHGNILGNLLEKKWLKRIDSQVEMASMNVLALLISAALFSCPPTKALLILLASGVIWGTLAYQFFCQGIVLPGALLILAILPAVFMFSVLYQFILYRRSLRQIQVALGLQYPASNG